MSLSKVKKSAVMGVFSTPYEVKTAVSKVAQLPKHNFAKSDAKMVQEQILKQFTDVTSSREKMLKGLESLKHTDVVQTILDIFIEDALIGDAIDKPLFTVTYEREGKEDDKSGIQTRIQEKIDRFVERANLDNLIRFIVEDLLLYGEYPLRIKMGTPDEGIKEIVDDMDPVAVVGVFRMNKPLYFLEREVNNIKTLKPEQVVLFSLSARKIRVKIEGWNMRRRVPEHLRVGKSIVYPSLMKLRQLQTLELANMAEDLKRILAPILVSVGIPASATPDDVKAITDKYESYLQENLSKATELDAMDLTSIVKLITNLKVLPNFSDSKGSIETLSVSGDRGEVDERVDRLRAAIAMANGMPAYYLTIGGEGDDSKLNTLKIHSRYARRLINIQMALRNGIKDLIQIHLKRMGSSVRRDNIKVEFKAVVNVELLDSIEYSIAAVETLKDIFNTLTEIVESDHVKLKLDQKAVMAMITRFLSSVDGVNGVIQVAGAEDEPDEYEGLE